MLVKAGAGPASPEPAIPARPAADPGPGLARPRGAAAGERAADWSAQE